MIRYFRCADTEALFKGRKVKRFEAFDSVARRKLRMLDAAVILRHLATVEALKKDRKGQHSIRINDQYRICFVWTDAGPEKVEIVDYH